MNYVSSIEGSIKASHLEHAVVPLTVAILVWPCHVSWPYWRFRHCAYEDLVVKFMMRQEKVGRERYASTTRTLSAAPAGQAETNKYVLFGHHFAAIAGAGPLVGPVLAAQMGYLPGTLWILAGAVFAGAIQDMTVLFLSTRRDGRSLGDIVRAEMGPIAGTIAGIGILLICVIVLAVLALVVVKALTGSPWGTFAGFCTIPIPLLMGVYNQFIRPGPVGEMSLLRCVLLVAALS